MSLREHLEREMDALRAQGLSRSLATPHGVDFASNDYLGLAAAPELALRFRRALDEPGPLTAPASRLLRGHLDEHRAAEERLARFKGAGAALVFPSGYQANLAVVTALIGRDDRVLSDALNHASLIDALRLTGATRRVYPHLDVDRVARELATPWPRGRTFVVTESYFSMDGDVAPLEALADLVEAHDAALIVDDAHATGIRGPRGAGLVAELGLDERVDAVISTGGKALGVAGAFVTGSRVLCDWLVHRARPFIFSTAVPPVLLRLLLAGVELAAESDEARARLDRLSDRLRDRLRADGLDCLASTGPIVPVIVGENEAALAVARRIVEDGFDVRAVRPPTVAPGTARLRISVHADRSENEIDDLADSIRRAFAREAPSTGSHA